MFKHIEFNSIRSRMVTGFLFLTVLLLVLAVVSLLIVDSITRISRTHSDVTQLQIYTLSLMKNDNDFFDLETINEGYFKTHRSDYIRRRDSLNALISVELNTLLKKENDENFGIQASLLSIDTTLSRYNLKFNKLEGLVFKKGFKDYGVEGAMRFHAHVIEETIGDEMLSLLYLRRHEKDFLLRSDTAYLTSFRKRMSTLLTNLRTKPEMNKRVIFHLNEYQRLFSELALIQQELGLSSKHGLRNELNALTNSLSKQYYALSEYAYNYTDGVYQKIRIFYVALLMGAGLFSIFSAYWISKRLSGPIAHLAKTIQQAIASGNTIRLDAVNAAVEVRTLGSSFNALMEQIDDHMKEITVKNNELIKMNRELDNFLYSTAHDLRSPLNSLLGLVNIVRRVNEQEELEEYFEFMEKSIRRSENFIAQIVEFSQNKKMKIVPELLDLHEIVSGILDNHQFVEGSDKIEKIIVIHDDIPFYSDRNRIIMILTNLISNAIKYSDPKKRDSFIRINILINSREAEIEVTDNGLGIEEEHLGNIFDMFFRANEASNGSGLGLFIFKETLTRLDGHASVESTFGIGTKFFVLIPNSEEDLIQHRFEFRAANSR